MDSEEWQKTRAEADIAEFKNAVEEATVEPVDVPAGRKDVEIAFERDRLTLSMDDVIDMTESEYYVEG